MGMYAKSFSCSKVIQIPGPVLSLFIQRYATQFARFINKKYNRKGNIFQVRHQTHDYFTDSEKNRSYKRETGLYIKDNQEIRIIMRDLKVSKCQPDTYLTPI